MVLGLPGLRTSPAAWVASRTCRALFLWGRQQKHQHQQQQQQLQQWRLQIRCAATGKKVEKVLPPITGAALEGLMALAALSDSGKLIGKDSKGNIVATDADDTQDLEEAKPVKTKQTKQLSPEAIAAKEREAKKLEKKYVRSEKVKKVPTPAPKYSKAARRFYNEKFRTEKERLSKVLQAAGVASRRACEEVIFAGYVTVNGKKCKIPETHVDPLRDVIYVSGKSLPRRLAPNMVFALHKPKGYICSDSQEEKKPISLLMESFMNDWVKKNPGIARPRLFTVGRLDVGTTGLILLTNDGEFAHKVSHPSSGITKEYIVTVNEKVSKRQLQKVAAGVTVDGIECVPVSVEHLIPEAGDSHDRLRIVVSEGRNHEVRQLVENAHLKVHALKRVRVGGLRLPANLSNGKYIQLTETQVRKVLEEDPVMLLSEDKQLMIENGRDEVEPRNAIAAKPDMVKPDMMKPDMVKPDMVKPDMVKPDMVKPKGRRKTPVPTRAQGIVFIPRRGRENERSRFTRGT